MTFQLQPAPFVTIEAAAAITGYTAKAIRRKIQDGVWIEGQEYRKAPDGRILISIKGYEAWVLRSGKPASGSTSRSMESVSDAR